MDKLVIKCKGNPDISLFGGMSTLAILTAMGIGFITIGNLASIITGLVLILISLFVLSRSIRWVKFSKEITIKYFIGKTKSVDYSQCKKMYKANDGMIKAPINVLKYDDDGRERKITFACDDSMLKEICDNFFNGFTPKFR